MVRAPSRHGLERKYKPWRRGKSVNAKRAGSLKNQLRSKKRLLLKIDDKERLKAVKEDITMIEDQINEKNLKDIERKNAEKYRHVKFFERQKLTRMERKTKKQLEQAKAAADFEDIAKYTTMMEQICMDLLYVAYFPNNTKYLALFSNGIRMKDDVKTAKKREEIMRDIIEKMENGRLQKKSWANFSTLEGNGRNVISAERNNYESNKTDSRFFTGMNSTESTMVQKMIPLLSISESEKNDKDRRGMEEMNEASKILSPPNFQNKTMYSKHNTSGSGSVSDPSISSDSDSYKIPASKSGTGEENGDNFFIQNTEENNLGKVFSEARKERFQHKMGNKSDGWRSQGSIQVCKKR